MVLIKISKIELKELYINRKLTTYEIADIYKCCQATIWKRLHWFNIKARFPWNTVNLPKGKLENLYVKKRFSTWKIEEKLGISRGTVYRKLFNYGIKRRNRAESHIIYLRKNFDGNKIDKAYLIGFAMGDLRVRKIYPHSETIHVDCGSTKKEQIDLILKLFKPYGKVWISKPNKKGNIQIECFLNETFKFLLKKRILMDKWIFNSKKCFMAFLAGFTDAEGCFSITNKGLAFYSLGNYNKAVLYQIYKKFLQFRIECRAPFISSKKGYVNKNGYVHNGDYWILSIIRKKFLLKLFNMIGPYLKHRKRINDMERAKENIRIRNIKFGNLKMN
jgi:hypothetical protein